MAFLPLRGVSMQRLTAALVEEERKGNDVLLDSQHPTGPIRLVNRKPNTIRESERGDRAAGGGGRVRGAGPEQSALQHPGRRIADPARTAGAGGAANSRVPEAVEQRAHCRAG